MRAQERLNLVCYRHHMQYLNYYHGGRDMNNYKRRNYNAELQTYIPPPPGPSTKLPCALAQHTCYGRSVDNCCLSFPCPLHIPNVLQRCFTRRTINPVMDLLHANQRMPGVQPARPLSNANSASEGSWDHLAVPNHWPYTKELHSHHRPRPHI